MTTYEERKKLMEVAQALHDLLRQVSADVREVTTALISAGDAMIPAAADEVEKGDAKTVQKITFSKGGNPDEFPPQLMFAREAKRACSLCRQPGHWAKNCPNAHKVREADMLAKQGPKPKRKMKPLTDERKAQLRRILAKARAVRGKK